MQMFKRFICLYFIFSSCCFAQPWFTGPLLAPPGETLPKGNTLFEGYVNSVENLGPYNRHPQQIHSSSSRSVQLNPLITYGVTDNFDVQIITPYLRNKHKNQSESNFGDISAILGYQLIRQKESMFHPDLRITLQEIFPTGRYEQLNATKNGIDGSGMGSYQTALALNFQYLKPLHRYYLRTRLSISALHAAEVSIKGLSVYKGSQDTRGTIKPGNVLSTDLAFELSVNQNMVFVMEGLYTHREKTSFKGQKGFQPNGELSEIGHARISELSLAPAFEFNFTENVGIIAGVWFSVAGKNADEFITSMIALNVIW